MADNIADDELDVLIVGAGQAGLVTGRLLATTACRVRLFEQAPRLGDSWRRRYDSLTLFSPRSHSGLPGLPMDGDPEGYAGKDEVADYLERYAAAHQLPVAVDEAITTLERHGDRFMGRTSRGRLVRSRAVVVATGPFQQAAIPPFGSSLSPGVAQLGADQYRRPAQLSPSRVAVVGGGATGRQIAHDLAPASRVTLSVGRPISITPQRLLGRDVMAWFDALGFLRADKASLQGRLARARESFPGRHLANRSLRRIGVRVRTRVVGATSDGLVFDDGAVEPFEAVIWATGYVDRSQWLKVADTLDAAGRHRESYGRSPAPGVFYVGRHWQRSRASALLCGVGDDAAQVVAQVQHWLAAQPRRARAVSVAGTRRAG